MSLDGQFIKSPCESWSQIFRENQKMTSRELNNILEAVDALTNEAVAEEGGGGDVGGVTATHKTGQRLNELLERLALLSRTASLADTEEKKFADRISFRLEHLSIPLKLCAPDNDQLQGEVVPEAEKRSFEYMRVDRWIGDFLLRRGYLSAALALEEEAGLSGLVDTELHESVWAASTDLREKGNYDPALSWCARNAPKLRRNQSPLKFWLHKQRFLQFVQQGQRDVALNYAETFLASWPEIHSTEIQEAMAMLLYAGKFNSAPPHLAKVVKESGEDGQQKLSKVFAEEAVAAFGLPNIPVLEFVMQCGLIALKMPTCYEKSGEEGGGAGRTQRKSSLGMDCPVCTDNGRVLGEALPYCQHTQSTLICRISGDLMDGTNPPLALPNGQVYGFIALNNIASKGTDGKVVCPVTREEFHISDARPLYIL